MRKLDEIRSVRIAGVDFLFPGTRADKCDLRVRKTPMAGERLDDFIGKGVDLPAR